MTTKNPDMIPEQDLILDPEGKRITGGSVFDALEEVKKAKKLIGHKKPANDKQPVAAKGLLGRLIGGGRGRRGIGRTGRGVREYVEKVPMNPKAVDADGDGLVQEGTSAERRLRRTLQQDLVDASRHGSVFTDTSWRRGLSESVLSAVTPGPTPFTRIGRFGGATMRAHPDAVHAHYKKMVETVEKRYGQIKTVDDAHRALRKAFPNLQPDIGAVPKFRNKKNLDQREIGFVHGLLNTATLNPEAAKSIIQLNTERTSSLGSASLKARRGPDGKIRVGHVITMSSGARSDKRMLEYGRQIGEAIDRGLMEIPAGSHNIEDPYFASFFAEAARLRRSGDEAGAAALEQDAMRWFFTSVASHEMTHVIHITSINKDRQIDLTNQRNPQKIFDGIARHFPAPSYGGRSTATSWQGVLDHHNGDIDAALREINERLNYNGTKYAYWRRGQERGNEHVPWDGLTSEEIREIHPLMSEISQYARKNPLEAMAESSSAAFMGIVEWDSPILQKLVSWMNLAHKDGKPVDARRPAKNAGTDGWIICTHGDGIPGHLPPVWIEATAKKLSARRDVEAKGLLGRLIGAGRRSDKDSSGRVRRFLERVAVNPKAVDGDGDGMVQEGTTAERRLRAALHAAGPGDGEGGRGRWVPSWKRTARITDGPTKVSEMTSDKARLRARPDLVHARMKDIEQRMTEKYGPLRTADEVNRALRKAFPNLVDTIEGTPLWRGKGNPRDASGDDVLDRRQRGFVLGALQMAELNPEAALTVIRVERKNLWGSGAAVSLGKGTDSKGVVHHGMILSISDDSERLYSGPVDVAGRTIANGAATVSTNGQLVSQPYAEAFAAEGHRLLKSGTAVDVSDADKAAGQALLDDSVTFMGMHEGMHEMTHIVHLHAMHKEYGVDFSNQRNPQKVYDGMLRMFQSGGTVLTWQDLLDQYGGNVEQAQMRLDDIRDTHFREYFGSLFLDLNRIYDHLSMSDTTVTHAQFGRHSGYAESGWTEPRNRLEAIAEAGASAAMGITEWDTPAMQQLAEWMKLRVKKRNKPIPAIIKDGRIYFCFHGDKPGMPGPPKAEAFTKNQSGTKSLLGRIGRMGRSRRGGRVGGGARAVLRQEPFDARAEDGDGDGLVQEGTIHQRLIGTRTLSTLAGDRRDLPKTTDVTLLQMASGARIHASLDDFVAAHNERLAKVTRKWGDVGKRDVAVKALAKAFPNLRVAPETSMQFESEILDNNERGIVIGLLHMAELNPDAAKTLISLQQTRFVDKKGRPDGGTIAEASFGIFDGSSTRGADIGTHMGFNLNHNGLPEIRERALRDMDKPVTDGFHAESPYLVEMMREAIRAERAGDLETSDRIMEKISEIYGTYGATHEFGHIIHYHAMNKDIGLDLSKQKNPMAIVKQLDEVFGFKLGERIKAGEDPIAVFTDIKQDLFEALGKKLEERNDTVGFDGLTLPETLRIKEEMSKISIYARKNDRELFAEAIAAEAGGVITIDTAEMRKLRAWLRLRTKAAQIAQTEEMLMSILGWLELGTSGFRINLCGTPDEPGLRDEPSTLRRGAAQRTKKKDASGSLFDVLQIRYHGDPNQINIKAFALAALMARTEVAVEFKAGLVGSKDPVLQAAQSVGSYVVPGDMSRVRSPIRSTLYRAATPGGGGGRSGGLGRTIGRGTQAMRCPAGYENGGRFSNRFLANCGQQLFDIPGVEAPGPGGAVTGGIARVTRTIMPGGRGPDRTRGVQAGRYTLGGTISRMASVPQVGAPNRRRSETSVASAIAAATSARSNFVQLVRRDGVSLQARVGIEKLAAQRSNNDMAGGTVISRASSAASIGQYEVDILANGAASARIVIPGGSEIRIDRGPNFSSSDASSIRRQWGTIRRRRNENDGLQNLRELIDKSPGKLTYTERFNNIENPTELVRIERNGSERTMPRWQYLAYFAESAPGRDEKDQPWKEIGTVAQGESGEQMVRTFGSVRDAQAAVDKGGSIDQVSARFLDPVLKNSKNFDRVELGNGRTLITRKNGDRYISVDEDGKVALSDRVAADLSRAMGVTVPTTRLAGTGSRRSVVTDAPDRITTESTLADVRPADLARIALADYLTGRRGRNPGSIALSADGDRLTPIPEVASRANMVAAIVRKPEQFLVADGEGGWVASYVKEPSRQVRQSLVEMYDTMVERASEFDWAAYLTRLGIDGDLSAADRAHLETVQRLFESRLNQLRSSRKSVLRILGGSA